MVFKDFAITRNQWCSEALPSWCSEALPSPSSWTAWNGEGVGTYTGSVGGSLIHLEAHFESLDFYFIGSEFVSSFSVLATRMTCRVLDRA